MHIKMEGMNSYLELVENGRPLVENPVENTALGAESRLSHTLRELLRYAHERGDLPTEGAWRLDARVCRVLERREAGAPLGGWARLAALSAGCGFFKAEASSFIPTAQPDALDAMDDAALSRLLMESFTRRLVPPASAAGLFILLGVHPAWALWVSHRAHFSAAADSSTASLNTSPGWRDATIFEPQTARCLQDCVFSLVACLVATLRRLDPGARYPMDAFARLTQAACRFARDRAQKALDAQHPLGLAPFLDNADAQICQRSRDFCAMDLFDAVFIPAGAARRFDDGSFCPRPDALSLVEVGELSPAEQDKELAKMLSNQADSRVA